MSKIKVILIHIRIKGGDGTVNMFSSIFTNRSKAVIHLRILFFLLVVFSVCLCNTLQPCEHLLESADLLARFCVVFSCVLSFSIMVSWVRCLA